MRGSSKATTTLNHYSPHNEESQCTSLYHSRCFERMDDWLEATIEFKGTSNPLLRKNSIRFNAREI